MYLLAASMMKDTYTSEINKYHGERDNAEKSKKPDQSFKKLKIKYSSCAVLGKVWSLRGLKQAMRTRIKRTTNVTYTLVRYLGI